MALLTKKELLKNMKIAFKKEKHFGDKKLIICSTKKDKDDLYSQIKKKHLGFHPDGVIFDEMEYKNKTYLFRHRAGGKTNEMNLIKEAQDFLDTGNSDGSMVKAKRIQNTIEKYDLKQTPLTPNPPNLPNYLRSIQIKLIKERMKHYMEEGARRFGNYPILNSSDNVEPFRNNSHFSLNELRELANMPPLQGGYEFQREWELSPLPEDNDNYIPRPFLMGTESRSPIGIEKVFEKRFKCKNCKYLTNMKVKSNREVFYLFNDIGTPRFYCNRDSSYGLSYSKKESFICRNFKINQLVLTTIQLLDWAKENVKSLILKTDNHPRYLIGGFLKTFNIKTKELEWEFKSRNEFIKYCKNDQERIPTEIIL